MIPPRITYQQNFQKGLIPHESYTLAMTGTIIKHSDRDRKAWHEYIERVLKNRADWTDWCKACVDQILPGA